MEFAGCILRVSVSRVEKKVDDGDGNDGDGNGGGGENPKGFGEREGI